MIHHLHKGNETGDICIYKTYIYAYNMFAHFRKRGKIIVRLRQEIEGAHIHSKYWPSLSAIPLDRRLYHFSAKSPLFLRTRPGLALLNYLTCFANTISCINHSNDPSDCQVQESVFYPICLRPGYANRCHSVFDIYWDASIVCI